MYNTARRRRHRSAQNAFSVPSDGDVGAVIAGSGKGMSKTNEVYTSACPSSRCSDKEPAPAEASLIEDDPTDWRRGVDDDCGAVDSRVEGALEALNAAMQTNNELAKLYSSTQRSAEVFAELVGEQLSEVHGQHATAARVIESLQRAKDEVRKRSQQAHALRVARENAQEEALVAEESLQLHEGVEVRGEEWHVVKAHLRERKSRASANAVRLLNEEEQAMSAVGRSTRSVVRLSHRLGEIEHDASPLLELRMAADHGRECLNERLREQGHQTERARRGVCEAMKALEMISLDIKKSTHTPSPVHLEKDGQDI